MTSLAGTARFMSPYSAASAAGSISPRRSISIARLRGTLRVSATIGVEQKSPILTPGVQNFAVSAATARSHVATSWQPAAVAVAWTAAMTGFGHATTCCISAAQRFMVADVEGATAVGIRAMRHQFLHIVAGAESWAVRGQHDRANRGIVRQHREAGRKRRPSSTAKGCFACPRGSGAARPRQPRDVRSRTCGFEFNSPSCIATCSTSHRLNR